MKRMQAEGTALAELQGKKAVGQIGGSKSSLECRVPP